RIEPSRRSASLRTSSFDFTTLTPPALPRPPAWICALTTTTGVPSSFAALTASSTVKAACPRGTGTPNSRSTALAWYSRMFMPVSHLSRMRRSLGRQRHARTLNRTDGRKMPEVPSHAAPQPRGVALIGEIRRDLHASLDQARHRLGRLLEHGALGAAELDFDDALDPFCADHRGYADIEVLDPVFAVEVGGARQHALLVAQKALRHGHGRRRRRIEGRAALEQVDDLGAAVARALDDLVEPGLRGPLHLDEIGQRDAGHGRIADQRHHAVAVSAEHEGGHVLDRDVELVGEEKAKACRVEHAGHADD